MDVKLKLKLKLTEILIRNFSKRFKIATGLKRNT